MTRPWTHSEKIALLSGIGTTGLVGLRRKTQTAYDHPNAPQRSRHAVLSQLRRFIGNGGLSRGSWSLRRFARETGYSISQLRRAQRALRQKWRRTGRRGSFLLSDDQVDEILEWLKHDYWDPKHRLYVCLWCRSAGRPHRAVGLCSRCYYRHRNRCVQLGLPTTMQLSLVATIRASEGDISGSHAKFLDEVSRKLVRGCALSGEQLEWLVVLAPEAHT